MKKIAFTLQILTLFLLASCGITRPDNNTDHIVISEVMAGKPGNNPYDFIELYNPTEKIIDLNGYSLFYLLNDLDEESLLYMWDHETLIPPKGHYLLGQEGQDFGIFSDTTFNQSLIPKQGGLILKDSEQNISDKLGWGDEVPEISIEGEAAPAIENGYSLERLPGSSEGNSYDSNNNKSDFIVNLSPKPQNTGSPITPASIGEITFLIISPEIVSPGQNFEIILHIENNTGKILEGITANISLPEQLIIEELGEDISTNGHRISWDIETLHESEIISAPITVSSPWTYTELKIHSTYITASNWPQPTFSSPFMIKIEGGSIPIETARDLINTEVVIEGIATMYTGGFYAGSGAKFYISDETGGTQVYVAGAGGSLRVNIGDRVRVQGIVTVYRDSIEIVPVSEGYVEILETGSSETTPRQVSIKEAANDRTALPGELLQVEGTLARVEEFSYSYEIDIVDPDGQLLTIYIDKLTEINIDEIQSGNRFKVAGILELLDGNLRLYPRIQDDFYRIYPETLIVEAESEVSVSTLNDFDIILHIFNHTKQPVSQIEVTLPVPAGFVISGISDGGILRSNDEIYWSIDQIAGEGSFKTVSVTGQIEEGKDYITVENYAVTAPNFQEIFSGNPTYTFAGGTVPIWAIQGAGLRSPYTNRFLETQGIVTAVFPDLEGFWLQEKYSDNDPKTSPGIFIYTKGFQSDLSMGDFVTVRGIIQEYFQQTEIIVGSPSNIKLINSNNDLPLPIQLNPPAGKDDASKYYESLEGSLVGVTEEAIVIAPTNRYGEFAFVLSQHNRTRLFQGEENGIIIMADDGSSETHNNQSTLDYVVAVGDNINNIIGPLAYSFGNYKIQPISPPEIVQNTTEYEIIAPPSTDEFSIMTWNVENLFDILDPHPSSPPLPKVSEYRQQISKVAETIIAGGIPMIVGLQEVENLGILEDITQHELLESYSYTPILIEGTDSRGIDVGYLVRSDQAEILLEKQYPAPEGITSRPPLLVKVQVKGTDNTIYVLNNHFTSMSGGEVATEPRRNAQAEWNVTIMENILREDPNAYLAVIGDLNSYYNSLPIDTLRDAGLIHVFERIPAEERYTYIYQGVSQTLDHILVNRSLDALISEVVVLHTNSGYPISSADDFSPIHKSDHDPVIVKFLKP